MPTSPLSSPPRTRSFSAVAAISVAQTLLAADAIDEVRLVVAPAIAGRGRRLLDGLPPLRLESLRSATSPRGYLLADYRISR